MPRRRAVPPACAVAAAAALAAAAGCSGPGPADLFLVQRSGSIPGAKLTLRAHRRRRRVLQRGRAQGAHLRPADQRPRDPRTSSTVEKDEDVGLAEKHLNLTPGRVTTLRYRVRSENGTVAFSDTSAHQPRAFYRLAQLTREVARQNCHLPR